MIRATLIISGDVQGAGYRGIIIRNSRKLGLVGLIENIPDGTVKVVCEGEKERIEDVINSIKIRDEIVDVENIDVRFEDASGEFDGKGFDVKASEKISDLYREMFHGYITSEKYFRVGFKKQDKMLEKQDQTLEKQDQMLGKQDKMLEKQDQTLEKQDKTIEVISNRFNNMDTKYSDIAKTLNSVNDKLDFLAHLFEKLVNHFVKEEK